MEEDTGDFWRLKFSEMQKKNMKASGRERMSLQNVKELVSRFKNAHPGVNSKLTINAGSADWEIPLNSELKMRFFIQSQVKGTILQRVGNGFLKIADAKFFSDPIPEISDFLSNFNFYERELYSLQVEQEKFQKVQKLTGEFIKALLKKKFDEQNILWNLEPNNQNFTLTLKKDGNEFRHLITLSNFSTEIADL